MPVKNLICYYIWFNVSPVVQQIISLTNVGRTCRVQGREIFSTTAPRPLSIQSIQMKKRDKKRGRREKMIWRGGNQFGLKNNALLELDGDCGPDCSAPLSHLGVWSVVVVIMVCLTTREKISAHTEGLWTSRDVWDRGERKRKSRSLSTPHKISSSCTSSSLQSL